ncbi:MAG: hypothetical protein NZM65_01955 [Flavobacteriales bacterium]|nr:hypothetical protein [Flavobacteriales bacterium]MDW8409431.1 OstA-like protein [Flavobacteriales bacterium]
MRPFPSYELMGYRLRQVFLQIFSVWFYGFIAPNSILSGQVPAPVKKPQKIEFLNADEASFDESSTPRVLRIRGRVVMRHEEVMMFCDSAWRYTDANAFIGFGRVHLQQGDSLNAYGDTLRYDGDARMAFLSGRVLIKDRNTLLRSRQITYNLNTRVVSYNDSALTESGRNTITSRIGYYEVRRRMMGFRGNVFIRNTEYTIRSDTVFYDVDREISYFYGPTTIKSDSLLITCSRGYHDSAREINSFSGGATVIYNSRFLAGDSLFYDARKGYGRARGHVQLRDTTEKVALYGHFAETFDSRGYSYITDSLTLILQTEDDSLFLTSDTLHIWEHPECDKIIVAAPQVRFYLRDLQGVCDSLVFIVGDSLLNLYHRPILWSDSNQLSARFITIQLQQGRVHRLDMYEKALIISYEDSTIYNQLGALHIAGLFAQNNLEKVEAQGLAVSIYYPRKEDGRFMGANKAEAEQIWVWLDDRKAQRIRFEPRPSGTLLPMKQADHTGLRLQGFQWLPHLRPRNRADIYRRIVFTSHTTP